MEGIHIAISAEKITEFLGVPITNTLITSWIVMGILIALAFFAGRKNIKMIPGKLQILLEVLVDGILSYMESVLEDRKVAMKILPFIVTMFVFILISNLLEFFPGIGSIGVYQEVHGHMELVPMFRSVNTDLNSTLALTIIAFFLIEVIGVMTLGVFKYGSKFINFNSVMDFFVGIIELFSELIRLISFSFRLFGNIFAGEVMLVVIAAFVPLVMPVPFMLFEVLVGFVQAAIFSLLTLFFIKLAITEPH